MRAHPVGVRLDERRALAGPRRVERRPGDRQAGEHVVAVDPDAGEAEAQRPLVERDAGLLLDRLGDRPLVVLAEEDERGVEDARPHERLVDVALAGRAVAEVGDHGVLAAVPLDAHRVAGRVQRLGADDDRVDVEVAVLRVPAAEVGAPVEAEQVDRVDAAAPGHAVLPVAREGHVPGPQRAAGADLRGLLAEQRRPDAQLALPLQRGRLDVDPADQDEVPVEIADLLGRDLERVVGMLHALTLRGEQLDEIGPAGGIRWGGDADVTQGHASLLAQTPRGIAARGGPAPVDGAGVSTSGPPHAGACERTLPPSSQTAGPA